MLNSVDQFLTVCTNAFLLETPCPVQGIADAAMILRNSPGFDWSRCLAQAQKYQLVLPTSNMVLFLDEVLQVDIPAEVKAAFAGLSIPTPEWNQFLIWGGHHQALNQSRLFYVSRPLRRLKHLASRLKHRLLAA
jgi:hypothetical protein